MRRTKRSHSFSSEFLVIWQYINHESQMQVSIIPHTAHAYATGIYTDQHPS